MGARPTAEYLEARAARLLEQAEELRYQEERFGTNDDYANDTVLRWDQSYHNGKTYSFVAIKAAGFWYTSGIFQNVRMSFDDLVQAHLSKADEVYVVTEFEEL